VPLACSRSGWKSLGTTLSPRRKLAATSRVEESKHRKYNAPVATLNPPLTFVAIALKKLGDFGGIGFEFYTTVFKPFFDEKEKAVCGSGWDARKKTPEFLQRLGRGVTIASPGQLAGSTRLYSPRLAACLHTTT
jgi:hypothetical protein